MYRLALAGLLLASSTARAQDGNLTSSPGPTFYEGETVVHTVTVGLVGHTFNPSSILANPGDKIMFQFYPGNHSFIQSLYGWPCVPEEAVDGAHGIYSGQFPNAQPNQPQTWNLTINDTSPIWFYCGAVGSCVNFGMLGAVNPANASQVEAQMDLAMQARYVIYPNDTMPAATASSISALAATVFPKYYANDTTEDDGNSSPHHGLSGGAIAGIVVGAVAVLVIVGVLIFWLGRNKGQIKALKDDAKKNQHASTQGPPSRPEMTVDGVTYVPAGTTGMHTPHTSYLPPYNLEGRLSPEFRSKSPESTIGPYSPPLQPMHGYPSHYSYPNHLSQNNYTDASELGITLPQPRHELAAEASPFKQEPDDVERMQRQTGT